MEEIMQGRPHSVEMLRQASIQYDEPIRRLSMLGRCLGMLQLKLLPSSFVSASCTNLPIASEIFHISDLLEDAGELNVSCGAIRSSA